MWIVTEHQPCFGVHGDESSALSRGRLLGIGQIEGGLLERPVAVAVRTAILEGGVTAVGGDAREDAEALMTERAPGERAVRHCCTSWLVTRILSTAVGRQQDVDGEFSRF
jgi:hypothetical protein